MSSINSREQKLLLFLSKNQDYVTSEDLTEILTVSKKTVYRLIKKINDEYVEGPLILSEKGRGYKLDHEKFINYQKSSKKYKENQFSTNERRKRIMEELLLSSPKPLNHHVDSYHIDIMDGHYVPNITLSPWFIEEVRKISDLPMSVHLMVTDPSFWVQQLVDMKCELICMHAEVLDGLAFRLIDQIQNAGLKAGVVLNPETPIETIFPYIELVDKITIMTVDPGFAGQRLIDSTLDKIVALRELREENGYQYVIEMDGSSNRKSFKRIDAADPDIYIIGRSGLFGLDEDIEKSWGIMNRDYEEMTGKVIV